MTDETEKKSSASRSDFNGVPDRFFELSDSLGEKVSEQLELIALRAERQQLTRKLAAAMERLTQLEKALEPRLKSILTLRSLRFALSQRNRIKRGELPSHGNFVDTLTQTEPVESELSPQVSKPTIPTGETDWKDLGIALFGHTRKECLLNTLESLARQDALHVTHVFLDGDQGNLALRGKIDDLCEAISRYPIKQLHRQRGHFGFRKMMLTAGDYMLKNYGRMIFLEDDCFPAKGAVAEFNNELDSIEHDPRIFSVYGHHFLVDGESDAFPRFQSWGWATTREKLAPIWKELWDCFLMPEAEYLSFVGAQLEKGVGDMIDATPGRQPTDTLQKFFAWDETVCLLSAMHNQAHKPASRRLIYNCGAGLESSHFHDLQFFRDPPFNMIGVDEVWRYYDPSDE